jgi:ATP-dependent Clp endopeptidase proteolytic subunit ClpP
MSKPTEDVTSPSRSLDEQAANARRSDAEARLFNAQAEEAEATAYMTTVMAEELREKDTFRRASDTYHHVYRFNGEVSSSSVGACMTKLSAWARMTPGCDIEVIFSSGGGSVTDGFVLYDFLRQLSADGHQITTGMQGMAASMAGILMQAGDVRWAGAESWYMIHRAAFGTQGKTYENEDRVDWIKRVEKRIIDIFASRTELTAAKLRRNWDRKDWWIDSDEALAMGLVDEIRGGFSSE